KLTRIALVTAFFFQAEDGIRDFHVTGVQTCALPILAAAVAGAHVAPLADLVDRSLVVRRGDRYALHPMVRRLAAERLAAVRGGRSEERRVGNGKGRRRG